MGSININLEKSVVWVDACVTSKESILQIFVPSSFLRGYSRLCVADGIFDNLQQLLTEQEYVNVILRKNALKHAKIKC